MAFPPRGSGNPGDFLPPPAQIYDAVQSGLVVSKLTFVDNQSGFVFPFENLRDDLIKGNDLHFNPGRK